MKERKKKEENREECLGDFYLSLYRKITINIHAKFFILFIFTITAIFIIYYEYLLIISP